MKKIPLVLSVLIFMILIVVKPDYFTSSAKNGLALFFSFVLPAIFPFFFCSLLLTKIGGAYTIAKIFGKPVSKLFCVPEITAFPAFISVVSGYPAGASTVKNLHDSGYLTSDEVKRTLSITSTSGPLFVLGTVGGIFQNKTIALVILLSHYLATFLNGLIWRRKGGETRRDFLHVESVDSDISDVIGSSALSMLSVGGYIVICNMLIDALALIPISLSPAVSSILFGMIEMTRGALLSSYIPYLPLSIAVATAVVTFGGLSVTLQSYGFLSKCGVRFRDYLSRKITQSIFAFLISIIFSLIF